MKPAITTSASTACGSTASSLEVAAPYVLVVVDMQAGFRASLREATIIAIESEIRRAIENKLPIVVLEYAKYPATHERLLQPLEGYDKFVIETKRDDDGSTEVIEACLFNGFSGEAFRVCGVNAHGCVKATVLGLTDKLDESKIDVVKAACNDDDKPGNWSGFPRRKNIHLV